MTLQELSRQIKLRERLERDREILASLQAAACPGAQVLTGMPNAPGVKDKVGDLAIEIADMKERIQYLEKKIAAKENEVAEFISAIEDERMRIILRLKFIRGLTWIQTATVLGDNYSEEGVKKMCYRFLSGT